MRCKLLACAGGDQALTISLPRGKNCHDALFQETCDTNQGAGGRRQAESGARKPVTWRRTTRRLQRSETASVCWTTHPTVGALPGGQLHRLLDFLAGLVPLAESLGPAEDVLNTGSDGRRLSHRRSVSRSNFQKSLDCSIDYRRING
jgi:hypothetical protein